MPRSVRGSDGAQGPHAGPVKVGTLPQGMSASAALNVCYRLDAMSVAGRQRQFAEFPRSARSRHCRARHSLLRSSRSALWLEELAFCRAS